MLRSVDTIEQYVERLEKDADEIVEKIDRLYREAEKDYKMTGQKDPLTAARRGDTKSVWSDPEGETKELQNKLKEDYEVWYAQSEELISEHLHRRLDEFQSRRSQMRDYIRLNVSAKNEPEHYVDDAADFFEEQRLIVKSVPRKVEAEKQSLEKRVSRNFSKDELVQARDLLDDGLTRAAGAVAGVALERHLRRKCEQADKELEFDHDDGIMALANTLYDSEIIDNTTLSSLETLGKIRNDCVHDNPKEPNKHKVRTLVDDTDDYIRGRGI